MPFGKNCDLPPDWLKTCSPAPLIYWHATTPKPSTSLLKTMKNLTCNITTPFAHLKLYDRRHQQNHTRHRRSSWQPKPWNALAIIVSTSPNRLFSPPKAKTFANTQSVTFAPRAGRMPRLSRATKAVAHFLIHIQIDKNVPTAYHQPQPRCLRLRLS